MKTSTLIRALIAGGLIGLASVSSHAAGLGRLTVQSSLGQPLQAEIELLSVTANELDSLAARVASPDAFQEARIQYSPSLAAIRFSVERRAGGQPYLRLTTAQPVNEPFIDMLVELTWTSGRLVREFPVLLDPPGFAATTPAPAVAAPTPARPAPAAPPATQPAAPAATPAPDTAAGDYKVVQGDTLYRIAGQVKPADVNLDQMVAALFRENRRAFISNNMNLLKSGAILRVPSAEQANSVTVADATREIRAQAADWNAYRNKLAGQVAASPAQGEAASQSATGKIGKATADQPAAPAVAPKDVLKLSKNAEGKAEAGSAASAQERINALQEEATARENQIKEEKVRVAELEKNIQELQKLLALKNQGMAELQKKAESAKAEPAKAEPAVAPPPSAKASETPAIAPETKPPVADSKPAPTVEPVQSATPAPGVTPPPVTEENKPAAEAKPKPAVKRPVAPPPPEPSFVDELLENPLYQAGAVAILALLAFFGYRAYRNRSTYTATSTGTTSAMASDLKSGVMGSGQASGVVDTGNSSFLTDFEKTGPGVIDIEEVDPVAEAEVYIAYGRDAQAEEILKEAMAKDSGRHEIPLKLLEIYAARKSATSFEATARELYQALGAGHPLWNRVADMGRKLDSANPLYSAGMTTAASTMSAAEPPAMEVPRMPSDAGPTTEELVSHGDGLDFDLQAPKPSTAFATGSLNRPSTAVDDHADRSLESSRVKSPAQDDTGLDFDLGGLDLSHPTSHRPEPPAAEQTLLARPRARGQSSDDLDLSAFESVASVTTRDNVPSQGSFTTSPSAELKLPTLSLGGDHPIIPAAVDTISKRPAAGLDLGALNLDIPATSANADSSNTLNGDSEWHGVATKLDLARAYLEIGDKDGAREILQEVIQEGDAQQKREAESLTASLS